MHVAVSAGGLSTSNCNLHGTVHNLMIHAASNIRPVTTLTLRELDT